MMPRLIEPESSTSAESVRRFVSTYNRMPLWCRWLVAVMAVVILLLVLWPGPSLADAAHTWRVGPLWMMCNEQGHFRPRGVMLVLASLPILMALFIRVNIWTGIVTAGGILSLLTWRFVIEWAATSG